MIICLSLPIWLLLYELVLKWLKNAFISL
jgi:hypothetical protein